MTLVQGFWRTVRSANGEHWRQTVTLLGYTLLGLAPLWLGLVLLAWFRKELGLTVVAANGEFALYTASLTAPLLYVLGRDNDSRLFPARGILQLLAITMLAFAIAAYAPIATLLLGSVPLDGFDRTSYSWSTFWLFLVGLVFFILVTLVENARRAPPVARISEKTYNALEKGFDDMGEPA